jgi:hypothetical protein
LLIRSILSLIIAGVWLSIAAGADHPPPNQTQKIQSVEVGQTSDIDVTIQGVHIRSKPDDKSSTIHLASAAGHVSIDFERSATVYVSTPRPSIVIVHDRFASNEDRLVLWDAVAREARPFVLDHHEPADYVHLHFEVIGVATDGTIDIKEYEYAGSKPSRVRTISARPTKKGLKISREQWVRDEP